jgi:hypothetical protein
MLVIAPASYLNYLVAIVIVPALDFELTLGLGQQQSQLSNSKIDNENDDGNGDDYKRNTLTTDTDN